MVAGVADATILIMEHHVPLGVSGSVNRSQRVAGQEQRSFGQPGVGRFPVRGREWLIDGVVVRPFGDPTCPCPIQFAQ